MGNAHPEKRVYSRDLLVDVHLGNNVSADKSVVTNSLIQTSSIIKPAGVAVLMLACPVV